MEQNSSQEGLDVSPVYDVSWINDMAEMSNELLLNILTKGETFPLF
jgi:hypothetical protein